MGDRFDGFRAMSVRARVIYVLALVLGSFVVGLAWDLLRGNDLDWSGYVARSLGVATGAALLVFVVLRRR